MTKYEGSWDPERVLVALGNIGYSPTAAILDIVDNSVSYGAATVVVNVAVETEQRQGPGRRRALVSSIDILDDGVGMDEAGLVNAIMLGSSVKDYDERTLSKYGMGLKSASAALGRRLTIISRGADAKARTLVLDQDVVAEEGKYVFELADATDDETAALDAVAGGATGTLVRIEKIHTQKMPKPADILDELESKAGVIYYYRLAGEGYDKVAISVNDKHVAPLDPLFEADSQGDLDDLSWDGLSVRHIVHQQPIQLDDDGAIFASVTMTQLPHPPSVGQSGEMSQAEARERYRIGAGNYGFYIYRNGRLISWADRLGGMVRQDNDLYSFRGRLEIGSDADEILNLNVAKSRIELSDIARQQLTPLLREGLQQSIRAWLTAGTRLKRLTEMTPHDDINALLDEVSELEERDDAIDEQAAPQEERERLQQRRQEITSTTPVVPAEEPHGEGGRVQYVPMLDNNQLWQRALDASGGLVVRVNQAHRMFSDLIEAGLTNAEFIKAFDILMYALARAEYELVYKSELEHALTERVMSEYRERVGEVLSDILRRLDLAAGASDV